MIPRTLSNFRGLSRTTHPYRLRREIQSLERKARSAPRESRAQLFNHLGDLYIRDGDRDRALSCYGRAIDTHLETGRYNAARALCRKVIIVAPEVVRAHCTLAFLALGEDRIADAEREIGDYVRAARRAGRSDLAARQLRLMANATDDQDIRLALARQLAELGDIRGSNEVFSAVYAERTGLRSAPRENQRERWARMLRIAVTGPPREADTPEPMLAQ